MNKKFLSTVIVVLSFIIGLGQSIVLAQPQPLVEETLDATFDNRPLANWAAILWIAADQAAILWIAA